MFYHSYLQPKTLFYFYIYPIPLKNNSSFYNVNISTYEFIYVTEVKLPYFIYFAGLHNQLITKPVPP